MRTIFILAFYYFFQVIDIAILVFCIGSWFVRPGTKFFYLWQKLGYFLDPIFRPAKIILSKIRFFDRVPVDFSPWLSVILLNLVYRIVMTLLI